VLREWSPPNAGVSSRECPLPPTKIAASIFGYPFTEVNPRFSPGDMHPDVQLHPVGSLCISAYPLLFLFIPSFNIVFPPIPRQSLLPPPVSKASSAACGCGSPDDAQYKGNLPAFLFPIHSFVIILEAFFPLAAARPSTTRNSKRPK